jgi:hypothetical protein
MRFEVCGKGPAQGAELRVSDQNINKKVRMTNASGLFYS